MRSSLALMVIAVSIATYFFYISPQIDVVKSLVAQKTELVDILNKVQEVKDKRDKLLSDYGSIASEDVEKLDRIIPNTFDATQFVYDIHNLASQYGLTVKIFRENVVTLNNGALEVEAAQEKYKTHAVNFTVVGPYANLVKFLEGMETSLNLVDINNLLIKSNIDTKTGVENLDIAVELNTYSLK